MRANSLYFKTPKYLKTCVCVCVCLRTSGDGKDWWREIGKIGGKRLARLPSDVERSDAESGVEPVETEEIGFRPILPKPNYSQKYFL